jgi:hypothetical protein
MGIRIMLFWRDSTGQIQNMESEDISIEDKYLEMGGTRMGSLLNLGSTGGARTVKKVKRRGSGSKRGKPAAVARNPAMWVSTGERVTLHDGKVRMLYRNERTGKVCVKKMVLRAGKRVAVYKTV